ncbi:MAG: DUF4440 domain-containing protein [Bacteroidetes bacterium]|jgi:hypothetical protein|nr:DUF4440 domain-containing protein [Bacteroidota bacterium]
MNYLSFIVLVIALLTSCSTEQSSDTTESDEILLENLLNEFLDGASSNDTEMHDRFWAEDLVYTGSAGNRITKEDIMTGLDEAEQPAEGETPRYGAEDVQIKVYYDAAIVAFRLTADAIDGRTEYYNTGTFLKRDGVWRAVAWQATRIPE